ncbi:HopJ type III effector protein [Vibrio cincinnatiensis]|uniref:HopJ type III effector protein n=1 Tax=Vibrio cincinnatiensis TaxID=675 RepID=UPI0012AC68AB|nr:HopJ type III effector protein [Vibrio cincinnatiensis]MCG3726742.1 type III effector [Vibrio cincinnatiensis]MCG3734372.1 type III effector [Vibrio cincinnatiensis]MCG3741516.1 type III effector [Vibrio cincinnatiensis]MCG3744731.1 type III effector [Vibrio cincinnatiensis]MCG3759910.1 type III effector [Vibrio cincinnatiensis]
MTLDERLTQIQHQPQTLTFSEVIATIDEYYQFTPTAFTNGDVHNEMNQNNGSCKIFAFAALHQLSVESTLACFGEFYRHDVLEFPNNTDHQNIRNFMRYGWQGIQFSDQALLPR